MRPKRVVTALVVGVAVSAMGSQAGASPVGSHSPDVEPPFEVVCDGTEYTLIDAPANNDHAEFVPAFVTGTHKVVIPFVFETTSSAISLSDGAVLDGVTYDSGDEIFYETESTSIGARRRNGQTCTFGGEGVDTFPDDNGMLVDVQFEFSGVATAMFPNNR